MKLNGTSLYDALFTIHHDYEKCTFPI